MLDKIKDKLGKVIGSNKEEKLSKEREGRCIPVARKIMEIMAEKDMKIGMNVTDTERRECYGSICKEVLAYMQGRDIRFQETAYCIKLVHEAVQHISDMLQNSLQMSMDACDTKLWGKEVADVTIQDMVDIVNPVKDEDENPS